MSTYDLHHGYQLTTDHPAAHYGIPVLLDPSGAALGPHDLIPSNWQSPANMALFGGVEPSTQQTAAGHVRAWLGQEMVPGNHGLTGARDERNRLSYHPHRAAEMAQLDATMAAAEMWLSQCPDAPDRIATKRATPAHLTNTEWASREPNLPEEA